MIYLKDFSSHASYESAQPGLLLPNVSYDIEHVHYNPEGEKKPTVYEMWYTTTDGEIAQVSTDVAMPKPLSNVKDGDHCVLTFEEELTTVRGLFYYNSREYNVNSVIFPSSLSSIGFQCFRGTKIETLTIPGTIKSLDFATFGDNEYLKEVIIEEGFESFVGNNTFQYCTKLEKVTLPASLKSLSVYSLFQSCGKLKELTYKGSMSQWEAIEKTDTWSSGSSITTIHCTDGDITL